MIDQLLEKYLTTYKIGSTKTLDVFTNPTKSELREIYRATSYEAIRFIADSKKKEVYVWNAALQIHKRTWASLHDDGLVEEAMFYNKPRYISGEADSNGYDLLYAYEYSDQEVWDKWDDMDWSWLEKYLGKGIKNSMEYSKKHQSGGN